MSTKNLFDEIMSLYRLTAEQATKSRALYGTINSRREGASRVLLYNEDGARLSRLCKALPELKGSGAIIWDSEEKKYVPNEAKARARAKELATKF